MKISYFITPLLITLLMLIASASAHASANDPVCFGNLTKDTACIGGSRGIVNASGNITSSQWIRGLFNWNMNGATSRKYVKFNGSTLSFNETKLNSTIDTRMDLGLQFNNTWISNKSSLISWNTTSGDKRYYTKQNANNTFIKIANEHDLNTNESTWWATVSGWATKWFRRTGTNLDFNETRLNRTIEAKVAISNSSQKAYIDAQDIAYNNTMKAFVNARDIAYNNSMKAFVNARDAMYNTSLYNRQNSMNGSMKSYVDAMNVAYNNSMKAYVNAMDVAYNNTMKAFVNSMDSYYNTSLYNRQNSMNNSMKAYVNAMDVAYNGTMKAFVNAMDAYYNTSLYNRMNSLNSSMKSFVNSMDAYYNTSLYNRQNSMNSSMKSYVNAMDVAYNNTMKAFVNSMDSYYNTSLYNRMNSLNGSMKTYVDAKDAHYNESIINYTELTYIKKSSEGSLNVNESNWWATLSGWVGGWFMRSGTDLKFNETKLNASIATNNASMKSYVDARDVAYNNSMKAFVNSMDAMYNTSLYNRQNSMNGSMKAYVDARDVSYNNSMKAFVNAMDVSYNNSMKAFVNSMDSYYNTSLYNRQNSMNGSMKTYVDNRDVSYNNTMKTFVNSMDVAYNNTMKAFVNSMDAMYNTSLYNRQNSMNGSMKTYVDAKDVAYNGSMKAYVNAMDVAYNNTMKAFVNSMDAMYNTSLYNRQNSMNNSMKAYVNAQDAAWNISIINYTETKYIKKSSESSLNVNDSTWWATVSGWVSGYFFKSGNNLDFNETKLNHTIMARIVSMGNVTKEYVDEQDVAYNNTMKAYVNSMDITYNNTMKAYVNAMDAYYNTSLYNRQNSMNNSMKAFVNAMDAMYNTSLYNRQNSMNNSMKAYVNAMDIAYNDTMKAFVNSMDAMYNTSLYNRQNSMNSSMKAFVNAMDAMYNTSLYNRMDSLNDSMKDYILGQDYKSSTWLNNTFPKRSSMGALKILRQNITNMVNCTVGQRLKYNSSGFFCVQTTVIPNSVVVQGNISADFIQGQPLNGSIPSGIIAGNTFVTNGGIYINHTGLGLTYSGFTVVLTQTNGRMKYCKIPGGTVTVPDEAHTVYYVNFSCSFNNQLLDTYVQRAISPGGLADVFNVMAHAGSIEFDDGSTINNKFEIRGRQFDLLVNSRKVISGYTIQTNAFRKFSMSSGQYGYLGQVENTLAHNLSTTGLLEFVYQKNATHWGFDDLTVMNITKCQSGTSLIACTNTNQYRRYFIFLVGVDDSAHNDSELHQLAASESITYSSVANCLNTVTNPLTYTIPAVYKYTAVMLYVYCARPSDATWTSNFIDMRSTQSATASSTIDTSIFLVTDASRGVTNNWNIGAYNISASGFLGKFYWKIKGFLSGTGPSPKYLIFNSTHLAFNETYHNQSVAAIAFSGVGKVKVLRENITNMLNCTMDNYLKHNDTGWYCMPDRNDNTTWNEAKGVTLFPLRSSVGGLKILIQNVTNVINCSAGEYIKHNSSGWYCLTDSVGNVTWNEAKAVSLFPLKNSVGALKIYRTNITNMVNCSGGSSLTYNESAFSCAVMHPAGNLSWRQAVAVGLFPMSSSVGGLKILRQNITNMVNCTGGQALTYNASAFSCMTMASAGNTTWSEAKAKTLFPMSTSVGGLKILRQNITNMVNCSAGDTLTYNASGFVCMTPASGTGNTSWTEAKAVSILVKKSGDSMTGTLTTTANMTANHFIASTKVCLNTACTSFLNSSEMRLLNGAFTTKIFNNGTATIII